MWPPYFAYFSCSIFTGFAVFPRKRQEPHIRYISAVGVPTSSTPKEKSRKKRSQCLRQTTGYEWLPPFTENSFGFSARTFLKCSPTGCQKRPVHKRAKKKNIIQTRNEGNFFETVEGSFFLFYRNVQVQRETFDLKNNWRQGMECK